MGLLSGTFAARRFMVADQLPNNWRDAYRSGIEERIFVEPAQVDLEEHVGWTGIDDPLQSSFEDFNTWLLGPHICLSYRIDKRTIPAKKLREELNKRITAWLEERDLHRCPRTVREELKEIVESELMHRVLPKTKIVEMIWNVDTNICYISSHSDAECDRVRIHFFRTFGRRLVPMSPTEWVRTELGEDMAIAMTGLTPISFNNSSEA